MKVIIISFVLSSRSHIVGVERTLGLEERTMYVINEQGVHLQHVTRTVTIRPRKNGRLHDPNMPPTYNQAVTGKDKSIKVDAEYANQQQGQLTPPVTAGNPRTQPPRLLSAPTYSVMALPTAAPEWLPPPPAYSSGAQVEAPSKMAMTMAASLTILLDYDPEWVWFYRWAWTIVISMYRLNFYFVLYMIILLSSFLVWCFILRPSIARGWALTSFMHRPV